MTDAQVPPAPVFHVAYPTLHPTAPRTWRLDGIPATCLTAGDVARWILDTYGEAPMIAAPIAWVAGGAGGALALDPTRGGGSDAEITP